LGQWASRDENGKRFPAGFQHLDVYSKVFPIVSDTMRLVVGPPSLRGGSGSADENAVFFLNAIRNESLEVVASLAEGYNKFHSSDKAKCYSRARACACRVQCLLLLASSLGFVDDAAANKLCADYESCLKMFNGLIKVFEEKQ